MEMPLLTATLVAAVAFSNTLQAGDGNVGAELAASCAGCHGLKGQGLRANPAINSLSETEFVTAFEAYANGSRNQVAMKALASEFSKAQIQDLAAYYASLK